jgi:hypothetical protein
LSKLAIILSVSLHDLFYAAEQGFWTWFWVGFVEKASQNFLVASAYVIFRLLKAKGEDVLVVV